MRNRLARFVLFALFVASLAPGETYDPSLLAGLRWRLAGPFRGGRVLTVTGIAGNPSRFYFGAVGGGVWRSDNAGRTWDPLFDAQGIASIGAIAAAPSAPRILYAGTGEADMRSDIAWGDGVYRSTDAGASWTRVGLSDSRQIGRILVDPHDPNRVFVASLGHAGGPNAERGLFRTADGGRTWKRVLFEDENTGAIDAAFDPRNPRTIFAALWRTRRPPWNVYAPSRGPGSGLYRSTDGGNTWSRISGHGFPSEDVGRIGLAFAPGDPSRMYAIVDAKEGGLYVSTDGGAEWTRSSGDPRIWGRGWYFGGVTVDPRDPNTVYVCNTAIYRSTDGGKTFVPVKGAPGGDDYHQLWIDPADAQRRILGSDQGAAVSLDGGRTWSSWYNQPTAQLYHVAVDGGFPYGIYGAQQDTGAVALPSRDGDPNFRGREWRPIAAGGESGTIVPDPRDPGILYGGTVSRFDRSTLQNRDIDPTLEVPGSYRRTWTLPLAVSPFDPRTLYFSRQVLFRTTDGGDIWQRISPDLTREDPGVPPNLDAAAAADVVSPDRRRGVIYAIAPSPLDRGLIWCGTDDGWIWKTRDGGEHWENVTPPGLLSWSKIATLEPSRFDAQTAYAAVDRHRLDDLSPYIYRTRDGGRSWAPVVAGLPSGFSVNVVREDAERRSLLYAGTEGGVFVSFDGGDRWQPLRLNLPACSVRDIAVRGEDLVIATHGRSAWVLDDVTPLRQLDRRAAESPAWLFAPAPAVRIHPGPFQGTPSPKDEPAGERAPEGAILDYRLGAASPVILEILDGTGELVRRYSSADEPVLPDLQKIAVTPDWVPATRPPGASPGAHRFLWDLHYPLPKELEGANPFYRESGLWAPPGRYTVRLTAAGRSWTQPLEVVRDPRLRASDADLVRQFELAREVQAARLAVASARRQAADLRKQLGDLRRGAAGKLPAAADAFARRLEEIDGPTGPPSWEGPEEGARDPVNLRILASALAKLTGSLESADAAPRAGEISANDRLRAARESLLARWKELTAADLARANAALAAAGLAPLRAE